MPTELPDFVRGTLLLGQDSNGDPVAVLVDENGQIQVLLRGQDALGDSQTVKVDSDGQLFVILRGADDVDVAVDASGFLSAVLKGVDSGSVLRTVALDTAGQIIMVPRGQSGHYMAVDSDGYIVAVLKGIRDGTLTTISVDANGRIEAFGLDAENQWGDVLKTGNSELAARLGSTVTYDWRGQTLAFSTFESGIGGLYTTLAGTGAEVSVSPDYSLLGGYSLKMLGGSDGGASAKVQGIVGTNPTDRVGLAVCWSATGTYDKVRLGLLIRKGATRYIARLEYDPGSGTFKYMDSNAAYQSIATVWLTNYPYAFNWLKLVVDVDAGTYLRALLNDVEYDLSAYALDSDAGGFSQAIETEIVVYSTSGNNLGIYLDRWVLTVNEPI